MKRWWRRIRGAAGLGLGWAAGWAVVGAFVGVGVAFAFPGVFGVIASATQNALGFAMYGFVAGTIFSAVLTLTEGRKRFDELSLPRFAGWGAAGGCLLGLGVVATDMWAVGSPVAIDAALVGVATILGAGSAAGSLVLAWGGNDHDQVEAARAPGRLGPP